MNELAVDYLQQGISLMKVEAYEDAVQYFCKALDVEPRYKEAYECMGDAYANLNRLDEALEAFKKVLIIDPNDGETYFNIGSVYLLKEDLLKCIENYNKAEEKGYNQYELYKNLADIYEMISDDELALRNYNKAIRVEPLRIDIRLDKAVFYINRQRFEEALETLDELQKYHPDVYEVIAIKCQLYTALNQHEKALLLIRQSLKMYPEDSALKIVEIKILLEMNRIEDAENALEDIKQFSTYLLVEREVYLLYAQIYTVREDLIKAEECFEAYISRSEDYDEEIHYLLLNIYNALENYEKALKIAKSLSERKDANLFTISGKYFVPFIHKKMGKSEEAKKEFRRLSSELRQLTVQKPHIYEAYLYRLLSHKELQEYDKALELADYIEALNKENVDAWAMRYAIYLDMGNQEKAEEMKRIVKRINPRYEL